jgi:hypothetical protein
MSERIIRVKSCPECPHFSTRWHSKEPTYYCIAKLSGKEQEDYGEELYMLDLIPLFCPLEKAPVNLKCVAIDRHEAAINNLKSQTFTGL